MTELPPIYVAPEESPRGKELLTESEALTEALANMTEVADDEGAKFVGEFVAQCRAKVRELDAERLAMGKGARDTLKMLNDKFAEPINALKAAAEKANSLLKPYLLEQDRKRREAEAAAREERAKADAEARRAAELAQKALEKGNKSAYTKAAKRMEKAEAAIEAAAAVPAEQAGVTGIGGSTIGLRDNWEVELVDFSKVPEDYLLPPEERIDWKAAKAMAKTKKEKFAVPGLKAVNRPVTATRTR